VDGWLHTSVHGVCLIILKVLFCDRVTYSSGFVIIIQDKTFYCLELSHTSGFFGRDYISALRGVAPSKFYTRYRNWPSLVSAHPNGDGGPPKNFWSWKFKIWPEIQRISTYNFGASGVSSLPDAWWILVHKHKRYNAHIDPPKVLVHCKLAQVYMPRGSTIENDTVLGVIRHRRLLREEFRISKLTFHSDLRRRVASHRALPRTSS